jgi:hypothetical protein
LCPAALSRSTLLLVTHFADPGVDFFPSAKALQSSSVFLEGISPTESADRASAVFRHKLHTIANSEGDAFLDRAQILHLYQPSLR